MKRIDIHFLPTLLVIFIGILAFSLILWITTNGIGISPDSTTYIDTSKNILAGNGLYAKNRPMTHYPPMYPLLLSATNIVGNDILKTSRFFHASLYTINLILFSLSIWISTKGNLLSTILGSLIFFTSYPLLENHTSALSEPPFITFSLLSLILISKYIDTPKNKFLILGAITLGMAMITRYAGIALLPPIVLGLFFFGNRPVKKRSLDTIFLILFASFPLGIWTIRNIFITNSATNRVFAFHPIGLENIKDLLICLFNFILPISLNNWIKGIIILVLVVIIILILVMLIREHSLELNLNSIDKILPGLAFISAIFYITFIYFSKSFFDESVPIIDRILLPEYIFLTIFVIHLVLAFSEYLNKPILWHLFIFFMFFSIVVKSITTTTLAIEMHNNGVGYNSRYWNQSNTLNLIKTSSESRKIYSNGNDVIEFKTEANASRIPQKYYATSLTENTNFQTQLETMCDEVIMNKAIIVYLDGITWRGYLPTEKELVKKCQLPILYEAEDGTIYGLPEK